MYMVHHSESPNYNGGTIISQCTDTLLIGCSGYITHARQYQA